MNIKLKAFLLALVYVAAPFIFIYVLFTYPLVIACLLLGLLIYLVYRGVLNNLERKELKK